MVTVGERTAARVRALAARIEQAQQEIGRAAAEAESLCIVFCEQHGLDGAAWRFHVAADGVTLEPRPEAATTASEGGA